MSAFAAQAAWIPHPRDPVRDAPSRTERRQRVCVPWRLVESAAADVALSVYVKVAALGMRSEGCTAGSATLASYLGLSTSSVERGLTQLRRPAPDGVVELAVVQRRTHRGGRGQTAVRRVRPLDPGERFVWLPVLAAEVLTPREFRAYAVISFAVARGLPLTEHELAGMLRHHSGKRAGESLSVWAASDLIDGLEARGWITVDRRAGARGRHRFTVHTVPLAGVDTPTGEAVEGVAPKAEGPVDNSPAAPADQESGTEPLGVGDGSGSSVGDGSVAYMDSPSTGGRDQGGGGWLPAVGEAEVDARVRGSGFVPAGEAAGGLALRADEHRSARRSAVVEGDSPPAERAYRGPELTVSPRVWRVLEPVGLLYPQLSAYMQRRVAREVGRQLDTGTAVERLRYRLQSRFARVSVSEIRDPGRWLLGVALPRRGCGHVQCEAGVMWDTGVKCETCQELAAGRKLARERERRLTAGLCPEHGTRPGGDGRCADCELAFVIAVPPPAPEAPAWWSCATCECPAPGTRPTSGLCRGCEPGTDVPPPPLGPVTVLPSWCCSDCGRRFERGRPELGRCLACEQRRRPHLGGRPERGILASTQVEATA